MIGFELINCDCPVCKIDYYNPVCAAGKAFISECHLLRQHCLKNVCKYFLTLNRNNMTVMFIFLDLPDNIFGPCIKFKELIPNAPDE